jgi:hypothetical protein
VARKKIKSATDQRKFTLVYNDFLESKILNYYEKMVFIALKKYADNDTMRAFPSLNTLHKVTGISVSQVRRSLDHMEQIGVIGVEHRISKEKGHQSNVYTLYDYKELWKAGSSEEIETIKKNSSINLKDVSTEELQKELERRWNKEKELESTEPTKVTDEPSTQLNQFDMVNTTTNSVKSQEERYTIDQIRQIFDYEFMVMEKPLWKNDIDSVFSILHTILNSTKRTVRVAGEDKPAMVVIGKLMKLTYDEIFYCIEKYSEQTERIKNPTSYMLTLLYNAKEQFNLDITNQVQHDMYHWNDKPTE